MSDFATELLCGNESTTKSTFDEDSPNPIYRTTLLIISTATCSLIFGGFVARFYPLIGSFLAFATIMVFREWNRIYGGLLTPQTKASINYTTVLQNYKEYIPFYDMEWLFGGKYRPYYYGCTGPMINPNMDRTPDDPESRSPTKPRGDEKLKKDD
uniref:Uncharacterized protein n=1 Tax=Caenorhabditis japonica TaxID=281687 RepID=A0A8R1E793_CAEJA